MWIPQKQDLAGTWKPEDVEFRKNREGPAVAKAHEAFLANQSRWFKQKVVNNGFPMSTSNGGHKITVLTDWTSITDISFDSEKGLQAFVGLLYGSVDIGSLEIKTLLDVHCLATYYGIPDLRWHLAEKIKEATCNSQLADMLTYSNDESQESSRREAVLCSVAKTLVEKPGKEEILTSLANIDLSQLKNLNKILPPGHLDLLDLLDLHGVDLLSSYL